MNKPPFFIMNVANVEQAVNVAKVLNKFVGKIRTSAEEYRNTESFKYSEFTKRLIEYEYSASKPTITYAEFMDEYGYVLDKNCIVVDEETVKELSEFNLVRKSDIKMEIEDFMAHSLCFTLDSMADDAYSELQLFLTKLKDKL